MAMAPMDAPGRVVDAASPARALRAKGGQMKALILQILSRAARAASAEKPHVSTGVSSLNYAGAEATANAPAAFWEERQRWAARAPHGQKRERQKTLIQYTAELLRQEVGR